MNLYFELLKMPVFKMEDVNIYYHNMDSARSAVKRLMKEGMVAKIRNNLYTCISGETGTPVANRFQIASSITPTSYVSHHTAMEYYGLTDQVFYEVYVSSETVFSDFTFDGYTYRYLASRSSEGIDRPPYSGGVAVTNLERTILDSVKDMDKIAGIEEVMQDIECVHRMEEKRLLKYLELYQNQFLYQKIGYLLWEHKEKLGLSNDFFEHCKAQIGKSKRYLTRDQVGGRYDDTWKLVVPDNLKSMKNGCILDDYLASCEERRKSVERATAILLTATNGPDEQFMDVLESYIAGEITLEEMERKVDRLEYLGSRGKECGRKGSAISDYKIMDGGRTSNRPMRSNNMWRSNRRSETGRSM